MKTKFDGYEEIEITLDETFTINKDRLDELNQEIQNIIDEFGV